MQILITANYTGVPLPSRTVDISRVVPFTLLVEPVHFRFLPATAGPLVLTLGVVLLGLWGAGVPGWVADRVEGVARGSGATSGKVE